MNNLGGYKTIELIFTDELLAFGTTDSGAFIQCKTDLKRPLPIHDNSASLIVTSKNEKAGILYTHKANMNIRSKALTPKLQAELQQVDVRGCILITTTHNNKKQVYGSDLYPLFGTFVENNGQKPSDLHCHELSLSSTCNHQPLPLIE